LRYKILFYIFAFCAVGILPAVSLGTGYNIEKSDPCGVAKFSGEGADFSLECAIHLCPFDAACGGTKLYEKLTILRQVREKVLKTSKRGKVYAALLGRHGAELARLVLEDPELAEGVRNIAKILIPIGKDILAADLDSENFLLDSQDAVKIKIVSLKFEEKASPALRQEIIELRFELDEYVNKTVREILAMLHGFNPQDEVRKLKEAVPKLLPIN